MLVQFRVECAAFPVESVEAFTDAVPENLTAFGVSFLVSGEVVE
ncbi:hypothetical protein [Streptomyces sp. VB1]|nr:hypothetical protein [Streptomyces sp. VB1]UZI31194.1 hypothetical protein OH133_25555 [Streptomyces sp. VB1]